MPIYSRARSKGGFNRNEIWKYTNTPSGLSPVYTLWAELPESDGEKKIIYDYRHTDYRKRLSRGEIVMGDLDLSTTKRQCDSRVFQIGPFPDWGVASISGHLAYFGSRGTNESGFVNHTSIAGQVALAKAYEKMNQSPLLTGEQLSSFRQTLGMLRKPLKTSIELVKKMYKYRKKSLGKTAESATKASANAWLEYRYGWKPLIMDGETAIDEIHKFHDTMRSRRLVARATEHVDSEEITENLPAWYPSSSWPLLASSEVRSSQYSGRASAGVIYEIKSQTTSQNISRILGIRARDIPATLWEIVPYSFVIDWFVNVGTWLNAVVPDPNVTVLGNWITRVYTFSCNEQVTFTYPKPSPLGTITTTNVGSVTTVKERVIRDCNQSLTLLPVLTRRNMSALHLTDALSLSASKVINLLKGLKH